MKHGTQEFWVQLHFMGLIKENWTCPGQNGPMRFLSCIANFQCSKYTQMQLFFSHFIPFYKVGLKGETMNLMSTDGISSADWMQGSLIAQKQQPLTWHKV